MNYASNIRKELFVTRSDTLVCFFLVLATVIVYWPVQNYGFTLFDDTLYVSENSNVKNGLTYKSFQWAFSFENKNKTYWHPLTWLSHMLDCEIYGLKPGKHHTTNLIFHILSTLLLFLVLKRMTGAIWQSAFVASLFALHPLNVNSVAWIAERKNVLSTFFWMLTMWVYAWYCERPKFFRYVLLLLSLALGLLSKPVLVTLPCVFILLDFWPLKRIRLICNTMSINKLSKINLIPEKVLGRYHFPPILYMSIIEKLPLFILCFITIYLSSLSQHKELAIVSFDSIPLMLRLENAIVSYVVYIMKMIWPINLAVFYPFPDSIPLWETLSALLILLAITVSAIKTYKNYPYFLIGWLWYLGTLVPMIGLIQAGLWPAMANRFTYIPLIGLFIIISWGGAALWCNRWGLKTGLIGLAAAILVILTLITHYYVQQWQNDIDLFQKAIDVESKNQVAHNNLGLAYMSHNEYQKAFKHISQAIKIHPGDALAHNNMGFLLFKQGEIDRAIKYYNNAIYLDPDFKKAHANLALAFSTKNRPDEAIEHYKTALAIDPNYAEAHLNLGILLGGQGKLDEAIKHLRTVLELNSDYSAQASYNLGNLFRNIRNDNKAIFYYKDALRINPKFAEAHNNLGIAYAKKGINNAALFHFQKALQISPQNEDFKKNLKRLQSAYGR